MDIKHIALNFEQHFVDEIVAALKTCDELYHNGDESPLTDAEYDSLRRYAQKIDPANEYFTGVGSAVRGDKVKLPFQMGSLDQLYEGDVAGWINEHSLHNESIVITDKLDGISCLLIFDETGLRIGYSRGDGEMGTDLTRHLVHMNLPKSPKLFDHGAGSFAIRAEVILSEDKFKALQRKAKSRSNKPYKNARNMVAGLMNASETNPSILRELSVIAYEIVSPSGFSKVGQLNSLSHMGFQIASHVVAPGRKVADELWLTAHLNAQRTSSRYAIDGVVLDVDSTIKRREMNPSRDTLNPEYARKYKVADSSNVAIAEVIEVQWNISKHGYLKPRVKIQPVELVGVTVQHATGFNAKFIAENKIGPGAKVKITRSGDVIPFIMEVVEGTEAQMPTEEAEWTETGVDLVLVEEHETATIEKIKSFFQAIDAPLMRDGNIVKMYEAGFDSIESIIAMSELELKGLLGANGKKIYDGLRDKLTDIPFWLLLGSTPYFGRGVGRRKWKKLCKAVGDDVVFEWIMSIPPSSYPKVVRQIAEVPGFEQKTAEKIVDGLADFLTFYHNTYDYITIKGFSDDGFEETDAVGGNMDGQKVVFTGFRDKDLQAAIEDAGGEVQSSFSGKTTLVVAKDPNSGSGKLKKARENGVRVIGIDDLRAML